MGAAGPIYYRVYAQDSAGNFTYQRPLFDNTQYYLLDPGNQRPTLSSAAATLNSNGSLTASITHVDPENDGMRLRASLVDVNGNVVAGSTICLPDCSTYGLGNTTSSVTWSAAQMASLTTPGSSYRVRFEVADYQSTTTPIYSVMDTVLISIPIPFSVSTLQPRTGVVNTVVPVTVTGTGFTGNINLQITNQNPSPCTLVTWTTTSATFNCALSSAGTTWSADVRAEQSTAVKYSVAFTVTAVATPTVTSITPGSARLDALTYFFVTGTALTSNMGFTVQDCDQVTEQPGGTSVQRTWTCYPRAPGVKQATLKTAPGGTQVAGGTAQIRVEHPQRMGDSAARGSPSVGGVHLFNGNLFLRFIDLFVPGRGLSAVFERTYNSYDWQYEADYGSVRPNSPWRFNFETRIGYSSTVPGNQRLYVAKADGSGESYFLSNGSWVPIDLGNFTTVKVNTNGTYTLQTRGQISYTYEAPSTGKLLSMSDRDGNTLSFRYGSNGKVDQVTDATGRIYTITTDGNGRVTRIKDFTNRYVEYTYSDASGRIATFRDVRGKMTRYTYNTANDLETIIEPNQYSAATPIPALKVTYTNVYGNRGVQSLTTAMGRAGPTRTCPGVTEFTYCFGFTQLANNAGFRTVVDGPENASALTVDFDNAGRAISSTDAKGHQSTTDFEVVTTTDAYATGSLAKVRKSALGIANGYQNTLTNNLTHGLIEVAKDAENSTSTTAWNIDAVSNLFTPSTVTSTLGYTSRLDYTPSGRPNNIIAPKQYASNGATAPSTRIDWTNGTVSSITDPNSNQINLTRDGHGNLTVSTDPRDPNWKTTRVPDPLGRTLTVTDARGGVTRYTYDDAGNVTSTTQEVPGAANIVNLYHYDDNGNMDQHTDPRLTVTTYTYDAGNRLTGTSKTVSGQTVTRIFGYDGANRLNSITNARNNKATRTFDSAGRLDFEYLPLSRTTQYEYDADNRLTKITDPMGRTVTYDYDRVGRVKSVTTVANSVNLVQRYEYDADGRLWKFYDQRNNLTEYGYDENGNLTSVKDANGVTSYATYDNANRMISRKDPRQKETLYEYDKAGNLTKETDPELNAWEYEYDENSNLIKVHNPDLISGAKRTITHQYDAANRRKQTTYSSGATVTYAYDANSNLTSMTDSIGTTTYDTYDEENRLTQFTDPFGNKVKYTYDKAGNREKVEYPGAPGQRVVTYGYDNAERMLSVLDWTGRQATYDYNFADQITKLTHGNGTTAEYGYDSAGRLTSLVNKQQPSGTVISSHTHTLDEFGNIRVADETLPLQPTLTPRLKQWNVDSANRVLSDTVSGDTFEHDAAGRMVRQVISGVPTNFSYNDLDLLTNLNRPGLAESYRYNGQGHRLERTVNGVSTRFLVEPNGVMPNLLADLASSNVPHRHYVYGARGLLSQIDSNGTYRAYHFGPVGHVLGITDSFGVLTDKYAVLPFGSTASDAGNFTVNPFRYFGEQGVIDDGNGLRYVRARYLSEASARFLTRDQVGGGIDDGTSLNRYVFARNAPTGGGDYSGLCDARSSCPSSKSTTTPDKTILNTVVAGHFDLIEGAFQISGEVAPAVVKWGGWATVPVTISLNVDQIKSSDSAHKGGRYVGAVVGGVSAQVLSGVVLGKCSAIAVVSAPGTAGLSLAGGVILCPVIAYVTGEVVGWISQKLTDLTTSGCAIVNGRDGKLVTKTSYIDRYVSEQELTGPNSLSTNTKQIGKWIRERRDEYTCVY